MKNASKNQFLPLRLPVFLGFLSCLASVFTSASETNQDSNQDFYSNTMITLPYIPANTENRNISCELPLTSSENHSTSEDINYHQYGWEKRVSADWDFFDIPSKLGKILIIDIVQTAEGPAYRYLANGTSQELYEPWSSSKVFAYTGALSKMREQQIGVPATVGDTNVSDMITGIHSYEAFGTASGESNKLATFFANLAGRDYLTSLFFDNWLKLKHDHVYFRGAYGPEAFVPSSFTWNPDDAESVKITPYMQAQDDPGYLAYKCTDCGLTGNKPMTTLAQAEWLKRLAMHQADSATQMPNLTSDDIASLFYGTGNSISNDTMAGMTLGISTMLHNAIASQLDSQKSPKQALDDFSDGNWRVFQKIGWGPSETRGTTENVVLAHVCLPSKTGGYQFTIAAQTAIEGQSEDLLPNTGKQMQSLLNQALASYTTFKAQ
ncbi:hypothetical protein [Glaciecola sp. 1036]|uniref:hypothetical protein n=1 Tax=Alteromonadaceae TaxID=72275 RepID=UPI003D01733A